MTDTAAYVTKAIAELDLVKSEAALSAWHEQYCNSIEYAYDLSGYQVDQLEDAYDRKLSQFMPAGLAG